MSAPELREQIAAIISPVKMKSFETIRAEWEEWHKGGGNLPPYIRPSKKPVSEMLDEMAQDEYDSNELYRRRLFAKADTILALIPAAPATDAGETT